MAMPTITAVQGGGDSHESRQQPPASGLTATAVHYDRWGWLVLPAGDRLLLTTNDQISAVELPAALGAEVQHYLTVRLLAGPVIALPGTPRRCLLLTQSADESTPVDLVRLRARGAVAPPLRHVGPAALQSCGVRRRELAGPAVPGRPVAAAVHRRRRGGPRGDRDGRAGVIGPHYDVIRDG
ncbi:hypothetical protein [Actinophytocola glycyrrhizae]|uniref:Uncharacterized protein n=1 Tax=Actinophytocola glycyrrhizae TaxID=2044873 RepID=A0ABV9SE91_9PSEU